MRTPDRPRPSRRSGFDAGAPARRFSSWLGALRRYALFLALANLLWESAQIPLYTLWAKGNSEEIAFAIVHCTAGDVVIAFAALVAALGMSGNPRWPTERFGVVAVLAGTLGLAYTVYSEWMSLANGAWAYTSAMPVVPVLGTGLSPMLQWTLLPPLGLAWARGRSVSEPTS